MLTATLLVVEDDAAMRALLEDELGDAGYRVLTAASAKEALEHLERGEVDVVVSDIIMTGMKGDELLAIARARHPDVPVILMTAFGSIDAAVESMKAGAFHYVAKPFRVEQLLGAVEAALEDRRLRQSFSELRAASASGRVTIVADSTPMRRALELARRAASADSPVLVLGESGTGKELIAQTLHLAGPRRERPFLALNCSAIPETLLESQLFGYRRGAFTDAREDRRGLFQEADGGTLFLDEIGDMPLVLQAKLLRVLQERAIHPLGATLPISVDVRVVAATHRNLEVMCQNGSFRQDLYYRLNVIAISIPPLRDRPTDLVPLIAHFLHKHGERRGIAGAKASSEVLEAFRRYEWPGNVRQLENVIERALVLGSGPVIRLEDLPDVFRAQAPVPDGPEQVRLLADVEREQIVRALRSVGGNKAAAARLLGLDRKTLYRKLQSYGLGGA